ncbi:hypothetical protein GF402_11915 [Candidatus Fermentibacteria bacterium]|nr:hypothetical protein [Candidatus Fermentibacteria bacterium]
MLASFSRLRNNLLGIDEYHAQTRLPDTELADLQSKSHQDVPPSSNWFRSLCRRLWRRRLLTAAAGLFFVLDAVSGSRNTGTVAMALSTAIQELDLGHGRKAPFPSRRLLGNAGLRTVDRHSFSTSLNRIEDANSESTSCLLEGVRYGRRVQSSRHVLTDPRPYGAKIALRTAVESTGPSFNAEIRDGHLLVLECPISLDTNLLTKGSGLGTVLIRADGSWLIMERFLRPSQLARTRNPMLRQLRDINMAERLAANLEPA